MGQEAKVSTFDPNQPWMVKHQTGYADMLNDWLNNPQHFLNTAGQAPTNFSSTMLGQLNPALMAFLNAKPIEGTNPFQELQFMNEFKELQNPFPELGAVNQALSTLQAATPIFDRNLKQANTNLATTAPGRFSSAIAAEGSDLNSRALQDFNLFANEALQQGMQLQQQGQDSVLNFLLGARNLQQGAVGDTRDAQISARGLQQDAEFTNRAQNITSRQNTAGNALTASQVLAGLAQAATQAGIDLRNIDMNALIALMSTGAQFNKPSDRQAVVQQGGGGFWGDILKTAIGVLPFILGGGNNNQTNPNAPGGKSNFQPVRRK